MPGAVARTWSSGTSWSGCRWCSSRCRAGRLGGTQKKRNAWKGADHIHRARFLRDAYDAIVREARANSGPPYRYLCGDNALQGPAGPVPVLNRRGGPTQAVLIAIAQRLGIEGNSDDAIYRNARRFLLLADK